MADPDDRNAKGSAPGWLARLAAKCRLVTAAVLARVTRAGDTAQVLQHLDALPRHSRNLRIAVTLGGVFALACGAAALGPIGLGVFFLAVIWVFR